MEKSCQTSASAYSSSNTTSGGDGGGGSITGSQNQLRALNKASHKISKPSGGIRPQIPNPNPNPPIGTVAADPSAVAPAQAPPPPAASAATAVNQNPMQLQPPVYNINKNDFRNVVQKLTGSSTHDQAAPPPPPPRAVFPPAPVPPSSTMMAAQRPPPCSSRLQRIRPPPLAQLSTPPPVAAIQSAPGWVRPPMSPLPPFPAVSAAAESPITAYMRRLRGGGSAAEAFAAPPLSPLGFGCLPSPRTAAASLSALSPSLLLPPSPGPVMSPTWRDT